jgi:hypothetical protein
VQTAQQRENQMHDPKSFPFLICNITGSFSAKIRLNLRAYESRAECECFQKISKFRNSQLFEYKRLKKDIFRSVRE